MKLTIISGLSGSGKSIVLQAMEDFGYYCIDNLPLGLLSEFAMQARIILRQGGASSEEVNKALSHVAVGIDARNIVGGLQHFPEIIADLKSEGVTCEVVFLDADDTELLKRFSETRRKHPLTRSDVSLAEALKIERELLKVISEGADLHIDTTHTNLHELRTVVQERIVGKPDKSTMSLLFLSFGFKNGIPVDTDFIFDVRCLPNPHWETALRPMTGLEQPVINFLKKQKLVEQMFDQVKNFVEYWAPHFEAENRSYLNVAIGCTGGRHRSVYLAQRITDCFQAKRDNVLVRHRDLS